MVYVGQIHNVLAVVSKSRSLQSRSQHFSRDASVTYTAQSEQPKPTCLASPVTQSYLPTLAEAGAGIDNSARMLTLLSPAPFKAPIWRPLTSRSLVYSATRFGQRWCSNFRQLHMCPCCLPCKPFKVSFPQLHNALPLLQCCTAVGPGRAWE